MSGLGNMVDTTKVRTAEDVERKHNLDKLAKNAEILDKQVVDLTKELDNFIDVTTGDISNLQTQIDGKVETWYYSGIPSLSNLPASNWTTDDEKSKHIGDLYYNQATGYVYRFTLTGSTYSWQEIHDEKAVDALSIANTAQDTADSKRRTFVAQPTPPYDNGDLWLKQIPKGTTPETYYYEIWGCQVSRQTGSYVATDWRLGATDDTYATAIVDELGGTTTTILSGQVVTEMANYTKFTDLATGGSTTIAGENITTGNIKSANYVSGVSGTNLNLTTGVISTPNATIDSDGLKLSNGAKVIGENGLKNTYLFDNHSDKMFIGFERDYNLYPFQSKAKPSHIDLAIPEGLEITKAVLHVFHSPVFWYIPDEQDPSQEVLESIGYVRALKVYKASNVQSRQIIAHNGEYGVNLDETTTYTDSGCTFYNSQGVSQGASWTPSIPTQQSYAMEEAYTSDISGLFKSGDNTIPGIYELMIKSSITPPTPGEYSDYELTSRTGWVYALLEIEGYMTYS